MTLSILLSCGHPHFLPGRYTVRIATLLIFTTLLCIPFAPARSVESSSSVELAMAADPGTRLQASLSLGCPAGTPISVTVYSASTPALVESFTLTATDSSPADILSSELADRMCEKLRELRENPAGEESVAVELFLAYSGTCQNELRESVYTIAFNLVCTDVSEIHAPSGADPGPAGDGFASPTFEAEAVKAYSPDGPGVAYEWALGRRGRHRLRFAAGIREESVTVPLTSDALALFTDETRIETELEVVPVDISYGYRLLPPDRRIVPTVYLGAGYAFADAEVPSVEGGDFSALLHPDLDALRGSDEDSLTLNAGLSLRFHLRRGGGGKYVYLGARARWYAQRDGEELDEEIFLGFGVPVCKCGRKWRRATVRSGAYPPGVQGEEGVDSGG